MSKDFLLSWCRHTCCGWVPCGPELKQFCVRMLSAAKRQHGGKAGKQEYLQTVPTPSVKESKTENRSLFITCLWISLFRGQAGRWKIFSQLFLDFMCFMWCVAYTVRIMNCIIFLYQREHTKFLLVHEQVVHYLISCLTWNVSSTD